MSTTIVIGLGEIGKPLYNVISKTNGDSTIGIDINPVEINNRVGIMHICIPFHCSKGFIEIVAEYARKYHPEITVVNSTVIPGTTTEIERISHIPTVYSPVRGKHKKMESELLHYQKFIAGNNEEAVKRTEDHFLQAGFSVTKISKPETLELSKLLETTYFGLLIAWAQEMDRFSRSLDGDYEELVKFFGEISYLPPCIFQPGFIGGHCIIPNIKLLESQFRSEFLNAIQISNNKKAFELSNNKEKLKERIEPVYADDNILHF